MVLRKTIPAALLLAIFLVTSCAPETLVTLEAPTRMIPTSTAIPTVDPPQVLSICMGSEPQSLFLYGDHSTAARAVRQALYDGPVDVRGPRVEPVILESLPSMEDGDVQLAVVLVESGTRIVDDRGDVTYLTPGIRYRPSGCFSSDCAEVYDGVGTPEIDQVVVRYRIRDDVKWSDGQPLTAADSEYSFQVARALFGRSASQKIRLTQAYWAVDETTVEWRGIPGYQGIPSYDDYFYHPLPEHAWGDRDPSRLLTDPDSARSPLGWGAYRLVDWVPGSHITLEKNPYYFQSSRGVPFFDNLVFRFVASGEEALSALLSGECSIVVDIPDLAEAYPAVTQYQAEGDLELIYQDGRAWEQITFGITRIDGTSTLFRSPEMRRAFASCIDRQAVAEAVPEAGWKAESYLPAVGEWLPDDPSAPVFDPEYGQQLLEEMGWVDEDGNSATPRAALGVEGVEDGRPLVVEYMVAGERVPETVQIIQNSLSLCGIAVQIRQQPAETLLAPGPEGAIFGRQFELAQFAWTAVGKRMCALYMSGEIPGPYPDFPKGWGGANASGYSSAAYDESCRIVLTSLPESQAAAEALTTNLEIFLQDLPVLPLYFRHDVLLVDSTILGLESGAAPLLADIEWISRTDGE